MAKRIPAYKYTLGSKTESDDNYWYIYLTGEGVGKLTVDFDKYVDIFFVGGGGAGGSGNGAGGGGSGYVKTVHDTLKAGQEYIFKVGSGGMPKGWSPGGDGESTAVLGTVTGVDDNGDEIIAYKYSVEGGKGGKYSKQIIDGKEYDQNCRGGNGGSGGGSGTYDKGEDGGAGGSNGSYGGGTTDARGGTGANVRTYAFGESTYPLYAAGGGGSSRNASPGKGGEGGGGRGGAESATGDEMDGKNGKTNTGSGGGGASYNALGGYGGSGVVIIRGTELDYLPVYYEGTRLQQIFYNGEEVQSLTFNGVPLFAEGD